MGNKKKSKITEKGAVVKSYLEKAAKNKTPKKTLAKIIHAENPGLFDTIENVRSLIRTYTGQRGTNAEKKSLLDRNEITEYPSLTKEDFAARFYFPSDAQINEPYILKPGRWGICSDIHYPYHSPAALEIFLEHCYKSGIHYLLLNGDFMDFYEISDFVKDRRMRTVSDEIYGFRDEILPVLKNNFAKIVLKVGNHEWRWTKFLRKQAPALLGFEEFRLNEILRLSQLNFDFVENTQMIKAGSLDIWHGHEIKGSPFIPVNPARSAMIKYKGNIIVGHHHRTSFEPMQLANGTSYGAWSTGCLCDLNPEYYPTAHTVWNHGFAELELEESGEFMIQNWRIINGKVRST